MNGLVDIPAVEPADALPELLGWMEALVDTTRLRLLNILERQELGVAELCHVLQLPQSTVSRHLKLLSDHGFVTNRRQGAANLYRMPLDRLPDAQRQVWAIPRDRARASSTFAPDEARLTDLLRQRQLQTQRFFAGAAAEWDKLREQVYGSSFELQAMLSLLPSPWTVLDLGCGTGAMLATLAPHVQRVIGIDQSQEMLAAAAQRTADHPHVELHRADLAALPLPPHTADAAMMTLVLSYLTDPTAALREARRVVKPGGRLVVIDLVEHDRDDLRQLMGQTHLGFSTATLSDLLQSSGWSQPRVHPLPVDSQPKSPGLQRAIAINP